MTPTPAQVERAREILPVFSRHNPIIEVVHPDGSRHTLKSFYVDELETLIAQALADEAERVRVLREALIKVKKVYISNVGHTDEGIPHKHCEVCWIDQALNQDSLGDGK